MQIPGSQGLKLSLMSNFRLSWQRREEEYHCKSMSCFQANRGGQGALLSLYAFLLNGPQIKATELAYFGVGTLWLLFSTVLSEIKQTAKDAHGESLCICGTWNSLNPQLQKLWLPGAGGGEGLGGRKGEESLFNEERVSTASQQADLQLPKGREVDALRAWNQQT